MNTNLSVPLTSFIGRGREMADVKRLLESHRLATLTGTGGTGKTRLALQVGAELLDAFKNGVFFVALAALTDPALVVSAIAHTLGVRESGGQPLMQTLTDYLQSKQLLLVLDNFEHLLAAAPVVNELLAPAPQLKVLVTSRAPLHLSGEREYPVPPLALPDPKQLPPLESLSQYAALELFIQRAQAVKPDFSLTHQNADAVVEICYRLDGLPLAIELAAARVKMLTPEAMLARLASRLKLLTGGARDLPARQQTLRNTIEWSYNLLNASEQQLFRRLALFAGGFSLAAAEAVCNAGADLQLDLFEGSASLLDKSLLQHSELGAEPRYAMLETIREYALQSLNASGEADAMRRRHAEYYLRLAESAAPALKGPQQLAWLNRLETELDNLRAALGWALQSGEVERGLRAASALRAFWSARAHLSEGREWLTSMLARPEASANTEARVEALYTSGFLASIAGEPALSLLEASTNLARELGTAGMRVLALSLAERAYVAVSRGPAEARAMADESLSIARQSGDTRATTASLGSLGWVFMQAGDYSAAQFSYEESIRLLRELGDKWQVGQALGNIGMVLYEKGEYLAAAGYLEQALEIMREFGDSRNSADAMQDLGRVVLAQGNYPRAQLMYEQSLTISRGLGNKRGIMMVLEAFASLAVARGRFESAVRLFGAIEALLAETGGELEPHYRADFDRNLAAARAQLDEAAFQRAWAAGRAMSMDQAIEYALATPLEPEPLVPAAQAAAEPRPKEPYPAGLSAREMEVLRLVVSGLTDAQVAEQLVLSPRTVGTHLQSIYSKLGVNSRTAATHWAFEHGLL
jgi:predicted ATPase/DNA-binding CsgD family transcriptional regulator/Tfp pilus assembly protein PilF